MLPYACSSRTDAQAFYLMLASLFSITSIFFYGSLEYFEKKWTFPILLWPWAEALEFSLAFSTKSSFCTQPQHSQKVNNSLYPALHTTHSLSKVLAFYLLPAPLDLLVLELSELEHAQHKKKKNISYLLPFFFPFLLFLLLLLISYFEWRLYSWT